MNKLSVNSHLSAVIKLVSFISFRAGNIVNPARADPTTYQTKILSVKAKSPTLVQANITCLCVTIGYTESSHLVSAREVGDRISKDITVYPIT